MLIEYKLISTWGKVWRYQGVIRSLKSKKDRQCNGQINETGHGWFTCSQRLLNYVSYQSLACERTWRVFQKHVVRTKLDIYVLIDMSIMWGIKDYCEHLCSFVYTVSRNCRNPDLILIHDSFWHSCCPRLLWAYM